MQHTRLLLSFSPFPVRHPLHPPCSITGSYWDPPKNDLIPINHKIVVIYLADAMLWFPLSMFHVAIRRELSPSAYFMFLSATLHGQIVCKMVPLADETPSL